jgi:hypothetical protein
VQCPRCRLINPPTAARCDCGHDFGTGKVEQAYFQQGLPRELKHGVLVLVVLNVLAGIGAVAGGDSSRIVLAVIWSGVIWWSYANLVRGRAWARWVLAVFTFPLGLILVLSPEVKLYCLQQQRRS